MFSDLYNTKYHDAKSSKQCNSTIDKTNFTCCPNCNNTSPRYICFTCLKLLLYAINDETDTKHNTKKKPDKYKEQNGLPIDIIFYGSMRDYQKPICDKILTEIQNEGSTLASLYTGWGKTCGAIWIMSQLKTKTLKV